LLPWKLVVPSNLFSSTHEGGVFFILTVTASFNNRQGKREKKPKKLFKFFFFFFFSFSFLAIIIII
jgi:hypothetical protein